MINTFDQLCWVQVDLCCLDKTGTLTSDDMVCQLTNTNFFLAVILNLEISGFFFQEFQGVGGLADHANLESDANKLPARTVEVLAACHALVFVENRLV